MRNGEKVVNFLDRSRAKKRLTNTCCHVGCTWLEMRLFGPRNAGPVRTECVRRNRGQLMQKKEVGCVETALPFAVARRGCLDARDFRKHPLRCFATHNSRVSLHDPRHSTKHRVEGTQAKDLMRSSRGRATKQTSFGSRSVCAATARDFLSVFPVLGDNIELHEEECEKKRRRLEAQRDALFPGEKLRGPRKTYSRSGRAELEELRKGETLGDCVRSPVIV